MEASALRQAGRRGLLPRRSKLLKLQGDERLVAMVRDGNAGAFEAIVDRYQGRLLGFCRQMLRSTEDAEDVLQEVFVNAYKAMIADNREINLRPWLYRIARNRCLNHLRKPTADSRESMDMVPMVEAASTAETVHNREEFRQLLVDVSKLPETQRTALLLREMDGLSYDEIAESMDTTVPSVKSLLVRARMSLSEASEARMLTCGEVRLALAEAAEGLSKASGPVRRHVRDCEECASFRKQLRSDSKAFAMIFPAGPLVALKAMLIAKFSGGASAGICSAGGAAGSASAGSAAAGTASAGLAGGAAAGGTAAAVGGGAAATAGIAGAAIGASGGAMGSAIGAKALAGVVTAAVITAGAVEVKSTSTENVAPIEPPAAKVVRASVPAPTSFSGPAPAVKSAIGIGAATVAPSAAELAEESTAAETATSGETATESATTAENVPADDAQEGDAAAVPELTEHPAGASEGNAHIGVGDSEGTPPVPDDPDGIVIVAPVQDNETATPGDPTGATGATGPTSPVTPPVTPPIVEPDPTPPPPVEPQPTPPSPPVKPDPTPPVTPPTPPTPEPAPDPDPAPAPEPTPAPEPDPVP